MSNRNPRLELCAVLLALVVGVSATAADRDPGAREPADRVEQPRGVPEEAEAARSAPQDRTPAAPPEQERMPLDAEAAPEQAAPGQRVPESQAPTAAPPRQAPTAAPRVAPSAAPSAAPQSAADRAKAAAEASRRALEDARKRTQDKTETSRQPLEKPLQKIEDRREDGLVTKQKPTPTQSKELLEKYPGTRVDDPVLVRPGTELPVSKKKPVVVDKRKEFERLPGGPILLDCGDNLVLNTPPGGEIEAGTTLSWEGVCGAFGSGEYTLSLCSVNQPGTPDCLPPNALYLGTLTVADTHEQSGDGSSVVGQAYEDTGSYTLSANDIDQIGVAPGDSVHWNMRYNGGAWYYQALTLAEEGGDEPPDDDPPEEEPPPVQTVTAPQYTLPPVIAPPGQRTCFTASLDLAPDRDASERIEIFVMPHTGGVNIGSFGWLDPTRMDQGAANDLAATLYFRQTAPGQYVSSNTGQNNQHLDGTPIPSLEFCVDAIAGLDPVTVYQNTAITDRDGEAYGGGESAGTTGTLAISIGTPPPPDEEEEEGDPGLDLTTWNAIAPAFNSPSCQNCHRAAASEAFFQGLSSQHSGAAPGMDPDPCIGCHTNSLLPDASDMPNDDDVYLHTLSWQASLASSDFTSVTTGQARCNASRDGGPLADDGFDHLVRDPLIIWAVQGGPRPGGSSASPAFGGIPAWVTAVRAWYDAGMPCPGD